MVDKSPIGYIPGKAYFLDKKPVKNPKYAHIGPTFKTGYHVDNIKILSDKHIVGRKGEMFKRIKPSTVANLMRREKNRENIYNLINNSYSTNTINKNVERETNTRGTVNRSEYSAYTLQSKVSKASGLTYATSQLSLDENTDYILVDFRERDDYEQYHLQEAIHFPGPAIARDKFPPELYIKKNKPNTLIIVYHLDEKHGIPYAAGLFDKGFENVFLISGGIEAFMEEALDLVRGKKVPTLAKRDNTRSNILYKRSKYTEYPDEGDVLIPPTHVIEENNNNNSFVSHSTATIKKTPSRRAQSIGRSYASRSKAL